MSTEDQPSRVADPDRVVAMLTLAFSSEPSVRWIVPSTERFPQAFADLVRVVAGTAFEAGTVDTVYDGAGAALWVPPDVQPADESYAEFFERHVDATRLDEVYAWGRAIGEHRPTEPHWYLAVIGVDPYWQGSGFGSQLLRQGLERCDRDGLAVHLDTSLESNVELFARHGFEVLTELRVADAPAVWPMRRAARS